MVSKFTLSPEHYLSIFELSNKRKIKFSDLKEMTVSRQPLAMDYAGAERHVSISAGFLATGDGNCPHATKLLRIRPMLPPNNIFEIQLYDISLIER